jgi:hypothetical protein
VPHICLKKLFVSLEGGFNTLLSAVTALYEAAAWDNRKMMESAAVAALFTFYLRKESIAQNLTFAIAI